MCLIFESGIAIDLIDLLPRFGGNLLEIELYVRRLVKVFTLTLIVVC